VRSRPEIPSSDGENTIKRSIHMARIHRLYCNLRANLGGTISFGVNLSAWEPPISQYTT
jgi:hypothetical protein